MSADNVTTDNATMQFIPQVIIDLLGLLEQKEKKWAAGAANSMKMAVSYLGACCPMSAFYTSSHQIHAISQRVRVNTLDTGRRHFRTFTSHETWRPGVFNFFSCCKL